MFALMKETMGHYVKKTYLISEFIVFLIFIYVFIIKVSKYTWGMDTYLIDLNVAIIFSCLLSAYRFFVYEGDKGKERIEKYGKIKYYFSKIFLCIFMNIALIIMFSIVLYFNRLKGSNDIIFYLKSLFPVFLNILIGTAAGILFSPVVLSIHQVIHGIFIIVVGINMTALSGFFPNSIVNYFFKVLMFLFPPIEQVISFSLNPVIDQFSITTTIWALIYSFVLFYGGKKIIEKKEIKYQKDNTISFE
ncbi:MAG: hypothetical protein M0R46_09270 [Candidatus Muirbacterium halophilum]|nr:hypothetical protein [Candidatus Muirbacterium halophilum]MCK9476097.1 hypothetical protein [Candidatus Muirbacterium halophilum]